MRNDYEHPPVKPQGIRIYDIWLLGPAMFVAGIRLGGPLGAFIALNGIATSAYNASNYTKIERRRTARRSDP